mmetsp:Transcript_59102/g.157288  ORF Transcript_59102/g.157288 Transcript_59102/m.157288 type:complete len:83 (-) Transcript_59102:104-352(-)
MGAVVSSMQEILEGKKIKKARARMSKLIKTAWWLGGNVIWTTATAFIVLGVPVFFEYEKECVMFEQMAQVQGAQMAAAPAIQ